MIGSSNPLGPSFTAAAAAAAVWLAGFWLRLPGVCCGRNGAWFRALCGAAFFFFFLGLGGSGKCIDPGPKTVGHSPVHGGQWKKKTTKVQIFLLALYNGTLNTKIICTLLVLAWRPRAIVPRDGCVQKTAEQRVFLICTRLRPVRGRLKACSEENCV